MRKFACILRGIAPVDYIVGGTSYSSIAAISVWEVQDLVLVKGNVNRETFADFIAERL